jgi:hypothetical protein
VLGLVVFLLVDPGGSATAGFAGQMTTLGTNCREPCTAPNVTESISAGVNVSVRWIDQSGGYVIFEIVGLRWYGSVGWVCQQTGTNGTCRFVSYGGTYTLSTFDMVAQAPQTVVFSGSYTPGSSDGIVPRVP